jgi:hypothetical protein
VFSANPLPVGRNHARFLRVVSDAARDLHRVQKVRSTKIQASNMMKQAEVAWEMDVPQLRSTHYNATLIDTIPVNDELRRFRIRPDWPIPDFQPGQYVAVGLGNWEPRVTDVQPEILREEQSRKLVRRAYSISCSMLDESGAVVPAQHLDYLEFYVALVRRAARPPALTPRLFALRAGDRLLVEQHIVGHYTLAGVRPDDDVVKRLITACWPSCCIAATVAGCSRRPASAGAAIWATCPLIAGWNACTRSIATCP